MPRCNTIRFRADLAGPYTVHEDLDDAPQELRMDISVRMGNADIEYRRTNERFSNAFPRLKEYLSISDSLKESDCCDLCECSGERIEPYLP